MQHPAPVQPDADRELTARAPGLRSRAPSPAGRDDSRALPPHVGRAPTRHRQPRRRSAPALAQRPARAGHSAAGALAADGVAKREKDGVEPTMSKHHRQRSLEAALSCALRLALQQRISVVLRVAGRSSEARRCPDCDGATGHGSFGWRHIARTGHVALAHGQGLAALPQLHRRAPRRRASRPAISIALTTVCRSTCRSTARDQAARQLAQGHPDQRLAVRRDHRRATSSPAGSTHTSPTVIRRTFVALRRRRSSAGGRCHAARRALSSPSRRAGALPIRFFRRPTNVATAPSRAFST